MWLVGTHPLTLALRVDGVGDLPLDATRCTVVPVGQQAFVYLIDVRLDTALPQDVAIDYDLLVEAAPIAEWAPHLLYGHAQCPTFVLPSRIDQLRSEERRVGKSVSVRVDLGGRRIIKKKQKTKHRYTKYKNTNKKN